MKNFALTLKCTFASFALSFLTACGDKAPDQSTQQPAQQNQQEVITVGVDSTYPPYDFQDERGNPIGFDVEIIQAIADSQKLNIKVVSQDWDTLMNGLNTARNDVILSGFMRTNERAEKYLLSNTYLWGQDVIAVKPDNNSVRSLQDLVGKNTATLANSAYIPQLEAVLGKDSPNIIAQPTDFSAFRQLPMGHAEAVLIEQSTLQYYAQKYPEVKFKMVDGWIEPYEVVMIAPKTNTELMTQINAGLAKIVADGTYAKIYEKWFGATPTKLPTTP